MRVLASGLWQRPSLRRGGLVRAAVRPVAMLRRQCLFQRSVDVVLACQVPGNPSLIKHSRQCPALAAMRSSMGFEAASNHRGGAGLLDADRPNSTGDRCSHAQLAVVSPCDRNLSTAIRWLFRILVKLRWLPLGWGCQSAFRARPRLANRINAGSASQIWWFQTPAFLGSASYQASLPAVLGLDCCPSRFL